MLKNVSIAFALALCLAGTGCDDGGAPAPGPSRSGPPPRQGYASAGNPGNPGAPRRNTGATLFTLPRVDGQQVPVRGPVALFFFTTWCGYCKQVLPEINRRTAQAQARGWQVYGIDVGEGPGQVSGFIQQYQPSFPVLLDEQSTIQRQYGVRGYPTFVLIDANGNVVYNGHDVPRNL